MTKFLLLLTREKMVFHGISSPLNLYHWCVSVKLRESSCIQSCRADYQPEVLPSLQHSMEVSKKEIDIEGTLMSFINNQSVILSKQAILLRFGEKDSIRHELDLCLLTDFLRKTNLVTNKPSLSLSHLLRNPAGNTGGCKTTGLGTANPTRPFSRITLRRLPNQLESHFRKLGCLAASSLPHNNDNPARAHRLKNLLPLSGNWKVWIIPIRHASGSLACSTASSPGMPEIFPRASDEPRSLHQPRGDDHEKSSRTSFST